MIDAARFPHAARIVTCLLSVWPEQERFLRDSFASRDDGLMASTDRHSEIILRMIGGEPDLIRYCEDYRFLCGRILEEEMHFRRTGDYRLSKFAEAEAEIYSDSAFMGRYMNFLLLTQVLLSNHAHALAHFEQSYLTSLPASSHHLEIGPGHGLLLQLAGQSPNIASLTGWDVSPASIEQTRHCLAATGIARPVDLRLQDMFDAPDATENSQRFDSVVMAEVLEHLEDPVAALKAVSRHMAPGGALWIHVPINSPAPDHLYLLRTPEEALDLVRSGGFEPVDHAFFPMSGQTLERARKRQLTISAVISARKPA